MEERPFFPQPKPARRARRSARPLRSRIASGGWHFKNKVRTSRRALAGRKVHPEGYIYLYEPNHPRVTVDGYVFEHILVAERAVGHLLPSTVVVAHVNERRDDNRSSNLAILESHADLSHLLRRRRTLRAGGDPWTQFLCCICKSPKDKSEFRQQGSDGSFASKCRACDNAGRKARYRLHPEPRQSTKLCAECGAMPRRGRSKYCSIACGRAVTSRVHVRRHANARELRAKCLHCKERVPRTSGFKYCSKKCAGLARHVSYPVCAHCGVGERSRNGRSKFCSAKCWGEAAKAKLRSQKTCPACQRSFWPRRYANGRWNTYCSRRCDNQRRAEGHPKLVAECLHCHATIVRHGSSRAWSKRRGRTFCSQQCLKAYNRGPQHHAWRGDEGKAEPNRGTGWKVLAASIRDRDRHTCRRCGVKWESGRRFPVDHVIPWRAFTSKADANDPANLATLCFSCHAIKTHIFEARWLKGDVLDFEQYRRAIALPGSAP